MTAIWIDAQLSPALAAWINRSYEEVEVKSVRAVGLRDADDEEIFEAAREANAVVMSKDSDFVNLLERHGPPPRVLISVVAPPLYLVGRTPLHRGE